MKSSLILGFAILLAGPGLCCGQISGNSVYGVATGRAQAEQQQRAKRVLTKHELPPSATSEFVEASVLMNVKADEYVAVFGITHDGTTLADCSKRMDSTLNTFKGDLASLGIGSQEVAIDFIAQNRIYGYEVQGDIMQEKLVGFELKKNVSIHFKQSSQLDKITLAAAKAQVFDLIKVDYVIADMTAVQDRLMEQAAEITKRKIRRSEKLLGIKLQPPAQIYAERYATHYPTHMYDSYTAQESEEVRNNADQDKKYTVRTARKNQTFFYNSLDGNGFDAVINPVVTEPVVQCTLYLKLKYEVEQAKAK